MASGGARQGAPGKAYAARTDLNTHAPLPPTAAPSTQYGRAAASLRSQQAVPMAAEPTPIAPVIPLPTQVPAGGAPPTPPPGPPPVDLHAPSQRPTEPVTAGLPVGAGGGPEMLNMAPTPQTLGDLLGRLSSQNPDIAYLAAATQAGFR